MTEAERLNAGIQAYLSGEYDNPRRRRPAQCDHGTWYWQPCEDCIDRHFRAVLDGTWKPEGGDAI